MKIKTTKDGRNVEAENGFVKVDGKLGSAMSIPKNMIKAALAINPNATAMIGNILLTQADLNKIRSTRKTVNGIDKNALGKLAKAKKDEDINYVHTEDPTFNSATEGQFNIYND